MIREYSHFVVGSDEEFTSHICDLVISLLIGCVEEKCWKLIKFLDFDSFRA
jgi:hypothetical protein